MYKRSLLIFFTVVLLMAPVAFALDVAPDTGTVIVKVMDSQGQNVGGNWYLYQGRGDKGLILRNGTKGETFFMPVGYYFFVAQRAPGKYDTRRLLSTNPQELKLGETITFEAQYFTTQAEMDAYLAAGTQTAATTPVPVVEPQPVVTVEPVDTTPVVPAAPTEPSPPPAPAHQTIRAHYVYAPTFETAPRNSSPAPAPAPEAAPATPVVYQLAATGPASTFFLLILISIAGGMAFTMRKKNIG